MLLEGDVNDKAVIAVTEGGSESDDDIPISLIISRDTPETENDSDDDEPPFGKAAEGEEVAFDFKAPHGVCIGAITEYDGDYYQATFDDGDYAD
jgi:hypothetical protein